MKTSPTVDEDGVVHDHPHCPGDDWTACHDQNIYGPCGHPDCYGADSFYYICTCICHEEKAVDGNTSPA